MKSTSYTGAFLIIVRYTFVCLIFGIFFSNQSYGQINPILEDADKTTPFGNCDHVPTKLNPDYKLTVNNISEDKSLIASYKINWGDNTPVELITGDFVSKEHTYRSLGLFNLVFTAVGIDGVSKPKSYAVSNQSNPALGISNNDGNTIGCSPLALSFTITGTANNAYPTSYEIDYGDGSAIELMSLEDLILANNLIKHTYIKSSCDAPGVNGQFTLKVKAINSCASTPAELGSIIVFKSPIPKFSTSVNDNGCINTSISFDNQTISGSGYNCNSSSDTYLWNFGDGNTSAEKNPTHSYAATGNYLVSLTSSNNQCVSVKTTTPLPICINPQPTASFTLSSDAVCKGTIVSVNNTSITENTCGNLLYTWTVDGYVGSDDCLPNASAWHFNTGSDKNSANPSFIFDNAGSYRINLLVSNGCGSVSAAKSITVKQVPTISIKPVSAICINQTINPTALVNNCYGETASTYNWQFSGGEPAASAMKNPSSVVYKEAGNFQILLSTGNECGLSEALPVTIQVNDYPKPKINGPENVCANSKGNVYSTVAGMENYQWSVSSGGVISSVNTPESNSITVDWKSSGNQTVSLNYNHSGCSALSPSVVNIKVNSLPDALVGNPVTVCSGEPVQIGGPAREGNSYSWISVPAGFVSNASAPTVKPSITTEYFLTETIVSTGCSQSNSVLITNNPLPVPSIDGPAAVCVNSENVIYTANAGMTNYTWTVSPGGIITAGGTSGSNTVSVTWNETGNQSISLNYTNDNGCTAKVPLIFKVAVNTSQIVSLVGPESVCEQSTGIIYTALAGMTNYDWKVSSEGKLISGGNATSNTAEIQWNNPGKQSVSVNYTQPGCQTAIPAIIGVTINARSLPVITGVSNVCAGAKNVVYKTEKGMTNYKWEISPGGILTSGETTNEIHVTWNSSGSQFVKVNYEGAVVCPSLVPTVLNVTVNQLQIPTISGELSACQGLNPVEYITESGMSAYTWKVSSGATISAGSGTNRILVVWKTAGEQNVSVSYVNSTGCSSADEVRIPVKVNPSPVVSVLPDVQEICSGSVATVKLTPSDGTVTYSWSPETISGTVTGAVSGSSSTIVRQLVNTESSIGTVKYT